MKISFGHVRDGQKVFSSPCVVADPHFVLFTCSPCSWYIVRYARMARQLPPYMPASYQADPPQKPPLGRVKALLGARAARVEQLRDTGFYLAQPSGQGFRADLGAPDWNCVGMTSLTRSGNFHFPRCLRSQDCAAKACSDSASRKI